MRNKVRTAWLKGTGAIVLFALPVLAQHGSSTVVNPYTSPEHGQAGAKLFRAQCAGCHGPDGTGTGAGASLASGTFVHGGSDEALFRTISKGVPGTTMPAFSFSGTSDLATRHPRPRTRNRARRELKPRVTLKPAPPFFARTVPVAMWLRAKGGLSGPDLTTIGARRSHAELRESISDPDAQVGF